MNELKILGVFTAAVLLFTILVPYGYTYDTGTEYIIPEYVPEYSVKSGELCFQGGDCGIWTSTLDWNEYSALIEQAEQGYIEAFGNEDLDTTGDIDEIQGTDDQFFLNAEGQAVMMYDMLEEKVVDPTTKACHLNRLTTTGFVSYATRLDQNTRFCAEYADETCEGGKTSAGDKDKAEEYQDDVDEVTEYLSDTTAEDLVSDWVEQLEKAGWIYDADIANEISKNLGDGDKISVYALLAETMSIKSAEYGGSDSPLNFAESDSTEANVFPNAKHIIQFPASLVEYTLDLQAISDREERLAIATGVAAIIAAGNIGYSIGKWAVLRHGTKTIGAATKGMSNKHGIITRTGGATAGKVAKDNTKNLEYLGTRIDTFNVGDPYKTKLVTKKTAQDTIDDFAGELGKDPDDLWKTALERKGHPTTITKDNAYNLGLEPHEYMEVMDEEMMILSDVVENQKNAWKTISGQIVKGAKADDIAKYFEANPTYGSKNFKQINLDELKTGIDDYCSGGVCTDANSKDYSNLMRDLAEDPKKWDIQTHKQDS